MSLVERMRARLAELATERTERQAALDAINDAVEARGDANLTDEESDQLTSILEELRGLDSQRAEAEQRLADLEAAEAAREAAEEARRRYEPGDPNTRTNPRVEVNEPSTYRRNGPHSFFADAFRSQRLGDFAATDRLRRHAREIELSAEVREERAVGTGAFGGLVVPQYLVDEFAPVLRNGRAFANAVRGEDLPAEGMTVTIPRGETGVTVAPQATQNTEVSNTDVDYDNDLTINVQTFAGQQDVSRQSLERGTPGIDRLLYADLVAAYAERLDSSIIGDDGTSGTHKGFLSAAGTNGVTFTSGAPTVTLAWPKLADAVQRVASNRKMAANVIVMHPRRWGWFLGGLDGDNRPQIIADPSAAVNAMGESAGAFGEGQLVGMLQGLPVIVDANIPTNLGTGSNEDRIFVARRQDPILWEEGSGMPRELRFEETAAGKLQVKLVVYGYSAFTAERYGSAVSIISGTGLVTPTF